MVVPIRGIHTAAESNWVRSCTFSYHRQILSRSKPTNQQAEYNLNNSEAHRTVADTFGETQNIFEIILNISEHIQSCPEHTQAALNTSRAVLNTHITALNRSTADLDTCREMSELI